VAKVYKVLLVLLEDRVQLVIKDLKEILEQLVHKEIKELRVQ
jgi:hypothetical protein